MLSLQGVAFGYQRQPLLFRNLRFDVPSGDVLGIVGRNGAGKSTLLRLINGLLRPRAGDVLIDGKSTRGMKVHQIAHRVGTLYQAPEQQLFAPSLRDELAFGPTQLKLPRAEIDRCVDAALARTHLTSLAERHPLDLSGAERRFTALASLLAMDPDILLLDEPQRGLDRKWSDRLESIISDESRAGKSIVLICHDMEFIDRNAQAVLALGSRETVLRTETFFADDEAVHKAGVHVPVRLTLERLSGTSAHRH